MISWANRKNNIALNVSRLESRLAPSAGYFRVVNYNIAAANGAPRAGLNTLLQAMSAEPVAGKAAQVDLIALQEVESQATTTQDVVNLMNGIYGAGVYARGSMDGDSTGSGTQGVVYNTQTLQLSGESKIGTASIMGQPRQALRYLFQPVGYPASTAFYVYNSHYKADSDTTSQNRRLVEANAIRADADSLNYPTNPAILYLGDFNAYHSSELFYQALIGAGDGQAFDPINRPGSWTNNASFTDIFTQAPSANPPSGLTGGGLDDRFDFQMNTSELVDGVGLDYVNSTYHAFGNNGSVAMNGSINAASSTALPSMPNRTTVLDLLTTVSDHLPVVADYQIITPPTATVTINDGSAQRSMVTSITVSFSENVNFIGGLPAAFKLQRSGPADPTGDVNLAFAQNANVVTITLNDATYAPQIGTVKSLIDGKYLLTLIASNIQGASGKLDGNGDGTGGDSHFTALHRLFGDANGDLTVNSTDFAAFRLVFGTSSLAFDFDGDNNVGANDFAAFRMRFGTML